MKWNERNIFLLDGFGALGSALTSGIIFSYFSTQLGLPPWLFYGLAAIALAFACYSFSCYRFLGKIHPEHLLAVILGNFSYCLVTVALVFFHPTITSLGKIVLGSEAVVIFGVVYFEFRVLKSAFLRR